MAVDGIWTMILNKLHGPIALTTHDIELHLGEVVSAGIIVLGGYQFGGLFEVLKVDRSDSHIRARLLAQVGSFQAFSYYLCESPNDAYLLHCEMYHCLAPIRGQHPKPPPGSRAECPYCAQSRDDDSKRGVA